MTIAKPEKAQNTIKESKALTLNPSKQWEQQQAINKHHQNHRLKADSSRGHCRLLLIFILDSAVVKTQNFSSHGGFNVSPHGNK